MNGEKDFALVPRPPCALEKTEPGAKRILSGMVADTLALVKKESPQKPRPLRIVMVYSEPGPFKSLEVLIRHWFKDVTLLMFGGGSAAWHELSRTDPDLLVTANCLPGVLRGEEIVRRLLHRKTTYPIIVMSAYELDEEWVREYASRGLNVTFLGMPWSIEQVRKLLESALRIRIQRETVQGSMEAVARPDKGRAPRIMMVDDCPNTLKTYSEIIQALIKEATVLPFSTSTRALAELKHEDPDLLIMDWYRPRIGGEQMLRVLAPKRVQYPILVLSGAAKEENVRQCAGPDLNVSFFRKPDTQEEMERVLQEILRLLGLSENIMRQSLQDAP